MSVDGLTVSNPFHEADSSYYLKKNENNTLK